MAPEQQAPSSAKPKTRRQAGKEQRYRDLLRAAGRLFGSHGYAAVTLDDIGREVGVSGQAIYRHFHGKQDLLSELLLNISSKLLEGGRRIQQQNAQVGDRIESLISFHVEFALTSPDIIRVQEQEMPQLMDADRRQVRRMQREYIEIWAEAAAQVHPGISPAELRTRIHGIFGLINSTARSMKRSTAEPSSAEDALRSASTLHAMARAAFDARSR